MWSQLHLWNFVGLNGNVEQHLDLDVDVNFFTIWSFWSSFFDVLGTSWWPPWPSSGRLGGSSGHQDDPRDASKRVSGWILPRYWGLWGTLRETFFEDFDVLFCDTVLGSFLEQFFDDFWWILRRFFDYDLEDFLPGWPTVKHWFGPIIYSVSCTCAYWK